MKSDINTDLRTQLNALNEQRVKLLEAKAQAAKRQEEERNAKILQLPQYLGVQNTDEVRNLIRQARRGASPFQKTWGRGRSLPSSVERAIKKDLEQKVPTREICEKLGVSAATIQIRKAMLGLTKKRPAIEV